MFKVQSGIDKISGTREIYSVDRKCYFHDNQNCYEIYTKHLLSEILPERSTMDLNILSTP